MSVPQPRSKRRLVRSQRCPRSARPNERIFGGIRAMSTVATDRKAIMRYKRAQGIAAMGLVTREGDRFRVATPSLRGRASKYEVWRDDTGHVRCSCLEFEENSAEDTTFRCEHILAVKHSLLAKNSEAVTKQSEKPAEVVCQTGPAPNINTNASEEREEPRQATKATAEAQSSEREQSET